MGVVIVCIVVLLVGCAAIVRWGSGEIEPPGAKLEGGAPIGAVARRYLWWLAIVFYTGLGTGLLVVGPAGRLAMRILAATAGDVAQGRVTEADEIVGRITVGGTIGLFIFVGLFFGLAAALGYVLLHRWLPTGRIGGLVYGALLVALVATRIDPLRRDNRDFDIVGPGWLAIVIYVVMALLEGMAIVAFAGGLVRALPEPSKRPRVVVAYVPLLLLFVGFAGAVAAALGFMVALVVSRSTATLAALRSRRVVLAGRLAFVIVAAASLPQTVSAIASIAGRP